MPILIRGLTLALDEPEERLRERAASRLHVNVDDVRTWAIVRRSIDARRKDRLCFTYNVELALADPPKRESRIVQRLHRPDVSILKPVEPEPIEPGHRPLPQRPIIVGFGPAGMFAGYFLASLGYSPLILERGADVSARHRDILVDFYRNGRFHPESNLLFGEGGAGTYSDGKLYTRVNDPRVRLILETFYYHGANPNILIDGKPHIGSDKLPGICRRIRLHINDLGGEVRFGSRLDDVVIADGKLAALVINGEQIPCGPVILATGQSARDTMRMLARRGVSFESKPFQMGVRIEHPQAMVDQWQYGQHCGHLRLPPAEYHLVARGAAGNQQDMFSFCMCPGGMILPTNESPEMISTNGASRSKRDGHAANSGLVVTVFPQQAHPPTQTDPLAAFDFLEQIERTAFQCAGGNYRVPVQRASDFLADQSSKGTLDTSYPLGGTWCQLREILPKQVADAIGRGIKQLNRRMPGFGGPDALIAAPETRASGPVRMVRDPRNRQSASTANLYPVGEGAGYAGGIISAAIDGLKTAESIVRQYAPAL